MAVGTASSSILIHVLCPDAPSPTFSQYAVLKGHMDWIRSLSFCTYTPHPSPSHPDHESATAMELQPGDLLLASGSQDKYIRIWKVSDAGFVKSKSDIDVSSDEVVENYDDGDNGLKSILDALDNAEMYETTNSSIDYLEVLTNSIS